MNYASERVSTGADALERGSSMLEAMNEIRSNLNDTMLRVRHFNNKHFGPLPPQPADTKQPAELTGQAMPTQGQFYHSKNVILTDLRELNNYLSNMENLI